MVRSGIETIQHDWYQQHNLLHFHDTNAMSTVYLCRMEKPTNPNGFYDVVAEGKLPLAAAAGAAAAAGGGAAGGGAAGGGEEKISQHRNDTEARKAATATAPPSSNRKKPLVVILRGVPGSGKSTTMKFALSQLASSSSPTITSVVCSADHYFERIDSITGEVVYEWSASKIKDAHEYCQNMFDQTLRSSNPPDVVVVDNTNVRRWNYAKYLASASKHDNTEVLVLSMKVRYLFFFYSFFLFSFEKLEPSSEWTLYRVLTSYLLLLRPPFFFFLSFPFFTDKGRTRD